MESLDRILSFVAHFGWCQGLCGMLLVSFTFLIVVVECDCGVLDIISGVILVFLQCTCHCVAFLSYVLTLVCDVMH